MEKNLQKDKKKKITLRDRCSDASVTIKVAETKSWSLLLGMSTKEIQRM